MERIEDMIGDMEISFRRYAYVASSHANITSCNATLCQTLCQTLPDMTPVAHFAKQTSEIYRLLSDHTMFQKLATAVDHFSFFGLN